MDDPFLGKTIDEYTITELFAQGGQGNIYCTKEHPDILLKIFHNLMAIDRAKREIAALKKLQHPGFVKIIRSGNFNSYPYFSMKFIPGESLQQLLENAAKKNGRLDCSRALIIAWRLADAMAYAHDKGIAHRDLKPENIIMASGDRPVIIDLGLVRQSGARTLTSTLLGTPLYMAPEQVKNTKGSDPQIDVYALGTIIYELLTGHWPLAKTIPDDAGIVEICNMILNVQPYDPRDYVPELSDELIKICLKCLEKDSSLRYPSAGGLRADLWPETLLSLKSKAQEFLADKEYDKAVKVIEKLMWLRGYESACGEVRNFFEIRTGKKVDIYCVEKRNHRKRFEHCRKKSPSYVIPIVHVSVKLPYVIMERAVESLAERIEQGFSPTEEEVFLFLKNLRNACRLAERYQLSVSLNPKDIEWEVSIRFTLTSDEEIRPQFTGEIVRLLETFVNGGPSELFDRLLAELRESTQSAGFFWQKIESLENAYLEILEADEKLEKHCDTKALQVIIEALKDGDKSDIVDIIIGEGRLIEIFKKALSNQEMDAALTREIAKALGDMDVLAEMDQWKTSMVLLEMLQSKDHNERYKAVLAFSKIKDERAVPLLVERLQQEVLWKNRETAIKALQKQNWQPQNENDTAFALIAHRDWQGIKKIWKSATPALLHTLKIVRNDYCQLPSTEWKKFIELFGIIGDEKAVSELSEWLDSDDVVMRHAAIEVLGKIGSASAAAALTKNSLSQNDWIKAMEVLGTIGYGKAIPELVKTLIHGSEREQRVAAAQLKAIDAGEKTRRKLLEKLNSKVKNTCRGAMLGLGELKEKRAIPLLQSFISGDSDKLRKIALEATGKIADVQAIPMIKKSLEQGINKEAIIALGNIGGADAVTILEEMLKEKDLDIIRNVIDALGKISNESIVPRLVKTAQNKPILKSALAGSMGVIGGDKAIKIIKDLLQDQDPGVVESAIVAAGQTRAPELAPLLWKLAKQKKVPKEILIKSLGQCKAKEAIPGLLELLNKAGALSVSAAASLGEIGEIIAVPALMEATKNIDCALRKVAVESLGKIASKTALPVLLETLQDSNRFVRQATVEVMSRLQLDGIESALKTALKDHEAGVRRQAIVALKKMGWKPVGREDKAIAYISRRSWAKLPKLGSVCVPFLLDVVLKWDSSDRLEAAKTLTSIGLTKEYRRQVREMIYYRDMEVRKTAILITGKIKDLQAVPALTEAMVKDPSSKVREAARRALNNMGVSNVH